ncbi:MAG TPA: type II toxin-antitoxin system PemK/MazF family toxin [Nitrospirae bacterium]|nr:type II toxin-antitoxin system PemK/MazF family toxin [Nitrospirota bacterium]
MYKQLEIRWVDLDPTKGAETRKKRPCIIVQDSIVNQGSKTIVIAPLLPGHKHWPFAVNLVPTKRNGIDKERHINLKQLRAVDVSRISNKQGVLESRYWDEISNALKIVLGLS